MPSGSFTDIMMLNEHKRVKGVSKYYNDKLVKKIQSIFTTDIQKQVVCIFYGYFNHSVPQFFIVANNAWDLLGFRKKEKCLQLVKQRMDKYVDYHIDENAESNYYLLSFIGFKRLCLLAKTKKADEVLTNIEHLQRLFEEISHLHSQEHKLQLEKKDLQIEHKQSISEGNYLDEIKKELSDLQFQNKIYRIEIKIRDIRDSI